MSFYDKNSLIIIAILLYLSVSACTKESWYAGTQSAKETQCRKEPISQYEECIRQFDQSYDEYSEAREQLLEKEKQKQQELSR